MTPRDYKFRGMDLDGNWHFGNLAVLPENVRHLKKGHYISNKAGLPFAYQVRPETVGQYTGLNDRNAKEIYEGDIHKLGDEVGAVEYHDGTYFVLGEYCARFLYQELTEQKGEVIGNIFEQGGDLTGTR